MSLSGSTRTTALLRWSTCYSYTYSLYVWVADKNVVKRPITIILFSSQVQQLPWTSDDLVRVVQQGGVRESASKVRLSLSSIHLVLLSLGLIWFSVIVLLMNDKKIICRSRWKWSPDYLITCNAFSFDSQGRLRGSLGRWLQSKYDRNNFDYH